MVSGIRGIFTLYGAKKREIPSCPSQILRASRLLRGAILPEASGAAQYAPNRISRGRPQ